VEDRFAALTAWHDFFAAVAGVSATLVGLLFIALALNPAVMADDGPAGLRTWAGHNFHSFLLVLVIALVVLILTPARWDWACRCSSWASGAWPGSSSKRAGCAATPHPSGMAGRY
jgi:hypothetical protein